jgi:tetratricopeptide (TPR) repeat protein
MGIVAIGTALLSLFFGLKEGYYFIQERQQQRAMSASYLAAAKRFLALDSLTYAEDSLERALALSPNDQQLRLQVSFLRADHLLREADYYGMQLPEESLDAVPEMIISGFSLLNNSMSTADRAHLVLALGRLFQYDRRSPPDDGIAGLFAEAYRLAPRNPEIAFRYGELLMGEDASREQGFALIREAADQAPGVALYAEALGRAQAKQGNYRDALQTLMRTIELRPDQRELQNIRAANEAKGRLVSVLLEAHAASPITGEEFFGMPLSERVELVRFALRHSRNRSLNVLAAQLFLQTGYAEEAEPWIRKNLGDYNIRSNSKELEILAAVLGAQGKEAERQQIQDILTEKAELATYEEVLETGLEGEHRYKIGLKLARENDAEGVAVLTAYEQYPFHKAGVRPGDRLLEFAHRPVESMRSITWLIYDLAPGTDVPVKIRRGDQTQVLTLVIE